MLAGDDAAAGTAFVYCNHQPANISNEVNSMGNRNINNKETKKKKKVDVAVPAVSLKSVVAPQPEIIKKAKKPQAPKDIDEE